MYMYTKDSALNKTITVDMPQKTNKSKSYIFNVYVLLRILALKKPTMVDMP